MADLVWTRALCLLLACSFLAYELQSYYCHLSKESSNKVGEIFTDEEVGTFSDDTEVSEANELVDVATSTNALDQDSDIDSNEVNISSVVEEVFSNETSSTSNVTSVEEVIEESLPSERVDVVCDSTGEYCVEPIQGKWIFQGSNRKFHAPICCSWDKDMFEELTGVCGDKLWPEEGDDSASRKRYRGSESDVYPVQTGGHACSCIHRNFTDEYIWTSPLLTKEFDPKYACQLLGRRTVLIIGDSTGQQFASALMNALESGNCAPQVYFSLSDTLLMRGHDRGHFWFDELVRVQPDICIWGVGPHIWGEDDFRNVLREVVANMTAYQDQQRQQGSAKRITQFVYKTQQPAGCSEQISTLSPDEAAIDMIMHNHTELYNHRFYYDRDLYALSYLSEINMPVIDLRMLYSRGEAHSKPPKDCLHFCSPGPLDVVADLFQNLLENDL